MATGNAITNTNWCNKSSSLFIELRGITAQPFAQEARVPSKPSRIHTYCISSDAEARSQGGDDEIWERRIESLCFRLGALFSSCRSQHVQEEYRLLDRRSTCEVYRMRYSCLPFSSSSLSWQTLANLYRQCCLLALLTAEGKMKACG